MLQAHGLQCPWIASVCGPLASSVDPPCTCSATCWVLSAVMCYPSLSKSRCKMPWTQHLRHVVSKASTRSSTLPVHKEKPAMQCHQVWVTHKKMCYSAGKLNKWDKVTYSTVGWEDRVHFAAYDRAESPIIKVPMFHPQATVIRQGVAVHQATVCFASVTIVQILIIYLQQLIHENL